MARLSMHRTVARWVLVTAFFAMLKSSCANYVRETSPIVRELQSLPTLDDIILTDPDLTTLAVAFETAELVGLLCTICNFTTFAPNNDAFAAIDQKFLATLLTPSWILHLQKLLTLHITLPTDDGNRVLSADFVDGQMYEMLNFEIVTTNVLESGITLTSPLTVSSDIVEADILASNGALHKIDTVLEPGFFGVDVFALGDSSAEFTILQELMDLIGLAGIEGEFTILAPTNEAFLDLGNETLAALKEDEKALGQILANHVIVGVYPSIVLDNGLVLESLGGLKITVTVSEAMARQAAAAIMFNDATVILADILARNGIVHAIDTVILDPDPISAVPSTFPSDVPSDAPSTYPSEVPSEVPSSSPSAYPTVSSLPSDMPSTEPSVSQDTVPSLVPSSTPSDSLSEVPTSIPSQVPSSIPSDVMSVVPSNVPSAAPSDVPSDVMSVVPSNVPSAAPSDVPSDSPSDAPSDSPSDSPSDVPSASPSRSSSNSGTTLRVPRSKENKGMEKKATKGGKL